MEQLIRCSSTSEAQALKISLSLMLSAAVDLPSGGDDMIFSTQLTQLIPGFPEATCARFWNRTGTRITDADLNLQPQDNNLLRNVKDNGLCRLTF